MKMVHNFFQSDRSTGLGLRRQNVFRFGPILPPSFEFLRSPNLSHSPQDYYGPRKLPKLRLEVDIITSEVRSSAAHFVAHFCKTFCKFLASTQETDANERPCIDGHGGSRGGGEHNSRAE